ncbi:unnamed protein product [Meloidogyne enterolobii]|uniref:Uncharacterized protein n=1 Tax=Meloidogyne enterolobii TaxID=390850 RepID=A0ACB0Y2H4_MELEN
MNVSVSLLKYMKAYDLFEAKANEWILEMMRKKFYKKNEGVSLETTENANYLPTSMVSEENENIDKENVDFKIYQYVGRIFYFSRVKINFTEIENLKTTLSQKYTSTDILWLKSVNC